MAVGVQECLRLSERCLHRHPCLCGPPPPSMLLLGTSLVKLRMNTLQLDQLPVVIVLIYRQETGLKR
ncbi:hypothetical protein CapIbe_008602 [Capra ibex]